MLHKTREAFHRRTTNNRSSQERKKATLDGEFNDDFEPVRPQMDGATDMPSHINRDLNFEDSSSGAPQSRGTNGHMSSQPNINRQAAQSTGPSNQKYAYDQTSGQKVFRVTT